ncbi:MAG: hypothetical protein H7Y88_04290, partial [Phycisphaerales bacterium]|nr:hypothetical protein [Phycisphaerales bacterium]
ARLTPEHVEAFRTAYTTELGAYVGSPDSAVSMFRSYFDSNVAARFEEFGVIQKRDEEIVPLTGEFQNIKTLLLFEAPDNAWDGSKPRTTDPDAFPWPLQNIGVLTGSGVEIWLLPELKPAPALPPAPSKPAPAEAPGEPESEPTEPAVPEEPK